jgi:hypothetical protein
MQERMRSLEAQISERETELGQLRQQLADLEDNLVRKGSTDPWILHQRRASTDGWGCTGSGVQHDAVACT